MERGRGKRTSKLPACRLSIDNRDDQVFGNRKVAQNDVLPVNRAEPQIDQLPAFE